MGESDLDPLLHQPVRTRLAAYVAARGEATFSELKHALETTDGNLEGHVKKLVAAGYLKAVKSKGAGRPQTLYRLSKQGLRAFHDYVAALQRLFPEMSEPSAKHTTTACRKGLDWQTN
ncbi:MAG: transcriptional regulator [Candidatus Thiodiazotropha sp.]